MEAEYDTAIKYIYLIDQQTNQINTSYSWVKEYRDNNRKKSEFPLLLAQPNVEAKHAIFKQPRDRHSIQQ